LTPLLHAHQQVDKAGVSPDPLATIHFADLRSLIPRVAASAG